MMKHGDFIITANWAPHDHGNPGKQPVMWLDVLDMPTINHFQTSFAEHFDEKMQKTNHEDGDSFDRYASGVLPDGVPATTNRSPVINYPYAKMRPILQRLKDDRRHRQAPRRARALRQSDQWRAGAAHHGRPSRAAAEGLQGRALSLDRRHHLRGRRRQGHHHHRRQAVRLGRQRRVRGAAVEALFAQRGRRRRCCSRSPTGRRRKRSASGGRGTDSQRPGGLRLPALRRLRARCFCMKLTASTATRAAKPDPIQHLGAGEGVLRDQDRQRRRAEGDPHRQRQRPEGKADHCRGADEDAEDDCGAKFQAIAGRCRASAGSAR